MAVEVIVVAAPAPVLLGAGATVAGPPDGPGIVPPFLLPPPLDLPFNGSRGGIVLCFRGDALATVGADGGHSSPGKSAPSPLSPS